jgi:hypothetical protein
MVFSYLELSMHHLSSALGADKLHQWGMFLNTLCFSFLNIISLLLTYSYAPFASIVVVSRYSTYYWLHFQSRESMPWSHQGYFWCPSLVSSRLKGMWLAIVWLNHRSGIPVLKHAGWPRRSPFKLWWMVAHISTDHHQILRSAWFFIHRFIMLSDFFFYMYPLKNR